MAGLAWFAAERANHIKFEAMADDATNRIEARIELSLSMVDAAFAYFVAEGGDVESAGFRRFVAALGIARGSDDSTGIPALPGIRGIGYAPLVPSGGEMAVRDRIARAYGTPPSIRPRTDQPVRVPVTLIEPQDPRNRAALGYDMYAEPHRRAALTKAIRTGSATATSGVQLVQNAKGEGQAGFLVYLPVYAGGGSKPKEPRSERQPTGFVYAAVRADELVSSAMRQAPLLPVTLAVYDGEPADGALLYRTAASAAEGYEVDRTLTVAGRTWTVRFRPGEAFQPSVLEFGAFVLGALALLLAGTLSALAWSQQQALDAGAALQKVAEKNLVEKDLLLQEMKHRIKNSLARVLAVARQTAASAQSLEDFSTSFAARMQAMATTQDMLTRSAWRQADLRALLVEELTPVFGRDLDEDLVIGEPVALNETATQALGLTFHELATNALKYGPVGRGEGKLTVAWKQAVREGRGCLLLEWCEEGAPTHANPGRPGFGTRLIDTSIRLELGGTIERRYEPDGLCITIVIPMASLNPKRGPVSS